jgi:hypothetical protein
MLIGDEGQTPAACVTVKTCVPTEITAERCALLLDATLNVTVPLPLPLAPEVIVTKLSLLVAVQLHPLGAVTLMLPVPPVALKLWLVGVSAETQLAAPDRKLEMLG